MTNPNLKHLSATNFKCFKNFEVHFGMLTILTGYNGSGKSSLIQPVLLLSQVLREMKGITGDHGKYWPLNGNLVSLGTATDVLFENYDDETDPKITFNFDFAQNLKLSCNLSARKKSGSGEDNRYLYCESPDIELMSKLKFISQLNYISAARGGVDEIYPRPDSSEHTWSGVGLNGQYASYLYFLKERENDSFRKEVDEWLDYIAPSTQSDVQTLTKISHLALKFRMSETSEYRLPSNVGFGLSYVFPIIVSLVASKKGDLIIIDSPEAHLHPQAQSRMGKLLAEFAANGRQIVVETHSDHVIKGIKYANKQKIINLRDINFLYSTVSKVGCHETFNPCITELDTFSSWSESYMNNPYSDL